MMKNLKYILLTAAVGFMAFGCEQSLQTYDSGETPANIYFTFANYDGQDNMLAVDSTSVSLLKSGVVMADSILEIPVSVMGLPVDYARAIAFRSIAQEGVTNEAVEDRDYELLPSEIMADSVRGVVRVKLLSSDALTAQGPLGLKFKLELLPNEHFRTDYKALNDPGVALDSTRKVFNMSALNFKVYFNNDTEFSLLWDAQVNNQRATIVNNFGEFSNEKVALIIELSGKTYQDWYPTPEYVRLKAPAGMWAQYVMQYLAVNNDLLRALKRTLAAAEAAGRPLTYYDAVSGTYKPIELGAVAANVI